MKELLVEEKAKRFDEAVESLRAAFYDDNNRMCEEYRDACKRIIEPIFPELKESEDEKIRKVLLNDFKNNCSEYYCEGVNRDMIITWLEKQGEEIIPLKQIILNVWELGNYWKELTKGFCNTEYGTQLDYISKHWKEGEHYIKSLKKQGEQKPADKVEPKFKVGDWVVVDNGRTGRIIECTKDFADVDLEFSCLSIRVKNIRSWTIQDAKDGDVLADGNLPFIFKKIDSMMHSYAYCGISVDSGFKIESEGEFGEWTWAQDIKPATKEQRDLLFQKMKEAGYEWDAEKKELKKIEPKPAWSEEDESRMNNLCHFLEEYGEQYYGYLTLQGTISWLKSLRPQNRWKPSEEQIDALEDAIADAVSSIQKNMLNSLYSDLKKLREE